MEVGQDTRTEVIGSRSKVFSARESQNMPARGQAETGMRAALGNLFALAESYPDLKANQTFQQLQTRISALENAIADRREFYNESVNINNVRIGAGSGCDRCPHARLQGSPTAAVVRGTKKGRRRQVAVQQLILNGRRP